MKLLSLIALMICASNIRAFELDELLDRADESLRISVSDDNVRARLSGTVDLEGYYFSSRPPGLITTTHDALFNPRLTLFVDAQLGPAVYFFAQARADRGFDPSDKGPRGRLDEYALRFTPWRDGRFTIEAGKFATVAGNWVNRHLSWDNPFINAPLPYENVTAASDVEPPVTIVRNANSFGVPKYERLPLIWGPSYASGLAVSGQLGKFDYAAEVKNSALSSRPEVWNAEKTGFNHPTVTARMDFRPNQMWTFGVSASDGAYLREAAQDLPPRTSFADFHQTVIAQDMSFAWHHWQLWAEAFETRFALPRIGDGDSFAYYVEAKYKFTPQLFAALRWNQQFFGTVTDVTNAHGPWDEDLSRVDAAVGYRFTTHTQLKLQYTVEVPHTSNADAAHTIAAQFTLRF